MKTIATLGLLASLLHCTTSVDVPRPAPPPLVGSTTIAEEDGPPTPDGVLTLTRARRLALANNPVLAARSATAEARRSELEQARALPNPELELSAEDLVVGDSGVDAKPLQISATLTQPFELGGDRHARITIAAERRRAAELDLEAQRLRVFRDTSMAFVDLLAAQRRDANASAMVTLAEETMRVLDTKSDAGRATDLEIKQTRVALALARIEKRKASEARESARLVLATFLGANAPEFWRARGGFALPEELPVLAELLPKLQAHPELLRRRTVVAERHGRLAAERAAAVPDVGVGLGYRRLNESGQNALLATVAVPVPLLDRNTGAIDAAAHEIASAESNASATELALTRQLEQTLQRLRAAHYEVSTLASDVVAEARTSYEAVVAGYALGRFGYLELLDAQRTLFNTAQQSVEARATFFKAAMELEALVGEPLFDWTDGREHETSELEWRPSADLPTDNESTP